MEAPKAPKNPTSGRGLFNTNMGPLQRQLRLGEYNLLKCAAMFESDFVQVSKQGGILDVHNQVQQVRVAIAATSPGLPVPDILLLARPVLLPQQLPPNLQHRYRPRARNRKFELTRLLPLCFVKITIHDQEKKQLRFKMVTGRTFYLQLCPPADNQKDNFDLWVKVVHLLRPPSDINQDKWRQDPWKSGDLAPQATISSATQASEEREISIAEVLSTLQEEILDSPGNTMDFLDTPSVSTSPTPTLVAIQERLESPFPLEAHSSMEEPWRERKKENSMALLPISRNETKDAPKETPEVAHGAGAQRKSKPRSKSSRSRRSHSSKRVVSQASRKISSLMGSFSGTSQKVPKSSRSSRKPSTSKERKR
ncbi:Golgi-associated RAB2B interactor protein 3-like isoform X2 [Pantherophis guttatus]|nr:Golgi-associated RAB2B interactor protein 3-like isoform X2 [Pantherophis guttatus]XP_034282189.1 Golgi-associated RAB2B interactor protein 3-like isoform X2 [Pantherophis guttatus]XP_060541528.1 Golgi-associated RAB2B interactor protein 3-like isoform X2 [Pantherophis guttatus]